MKTEQTQTTPSSSIDTRQSADTISTLSLNETPDGEEGLDSEDTSELFEHDDELFADDDIEVVDDLLSDDDAEHSHRPTYFD